MVTCPGCGSRASLGFTFCPRCGRRLPSTCAACGFTCEPDFAFCPRCGAVRSPGAAGATAPTRVGPRKIPAPAQPDGTGREADRRLPILEAAAAIAKLDGYKENETDKAEQERQWPQLKCQFLIDRGGIVRWASVECATEGIARVGKFPSDGKILTAARALPRT